MRKLPKEPKTHKVSLQICPEGSIRDRILARRRQKRTHKTVGLLFRWQKP